MKKFFTLFAAVAAFAMTGQAKQVLEGTFSGWSSDVTIDGNTITFAGAWQGAGLWLAGEDSPLDLSAYDYVVYKFAEPIEGDVQVCVEAQDPADATKLVASATYAASAGAKVVAVPLTDAKIADAIDKVKQTWIQSKTPAKVVIAEVYAGTEAEYQADINDNKIERSDISLADLPSGWGESTYDADTKAITIGNNWSGKGWWLGSFDASGFDYVVVEFAEATDSIGKIVIEYNDGTNNGDDGLFQQKCLVKVVPLSAAKNDLKQIYIQGPEKSIYKLSAAYYATEKYITDNSVADKYAATEGINDVKAAVAADNKVYNLAGQRVDAAYRGVVIRNGRKYIQK